VMLSQNDKFYNEIQTNEQLSDVGKIFKRIYDSGESLDRVGEFRLEELKTLMTSKIGPFGEISINHIEMAKVLKTGAMTDQHCAAEFLDGVMGTFSVIFDTQPITKSTTTHTCLNCNIVKLNGQRDVPEFVLKLPQQSKKRNVNDLISEMTNNKRTNLNYNCWSEVCDPQGLQNVHHPGIEDYSVNFLGPDQFYVTLSPYNSHIDPNNGFLNIALADNYENVQISYNLEIKGFKYNLEALTAKSGLSADSGHYMTFIIPADSPMQLHNDGNISPSRTDINNQNIIVNGTSFHPIILLYKRSSVHTAPRFQGPAPKFQGPATNFEEKKNIEKLPIKIQPKSINVEKKELFRNMEHFIEETFDQISSNPNNSITGKKIRLFTDKIQKKFSLKFDQSIEGKIKIIQKKGNTE
jgi:hypothetical protein